jgi:hypothetical protein
MGTFFLYSCCASTTTSTYSTNLTPCRIVFTHGIPLARWPRFSSYGRSCYHYSLTLARSKVAGGKHTSTENDFIAGIEISIWTTWLQSVINMQAGVYPRYARATAALRRFDINRSTVVVLAAHGCGGHKRTN